MRAAAPSRMSDSNGAKSSHSIASRNDIIPLTSGPCLALRPNTGAGRHREFRRPGSFTHRARRLMLSERVSSTVSLVHSQPQRVEPRPAIAV